MSDWIYQMQPLTSPPPFSSSQITTFSSYFVSLLPDIPSKLCSQNSSHSISLEGWLNPVIFFFFCLEASCNFSFQSKCQTPYNQQSVVCILVSCYLSNLFYILLCSHPVLALSYSDAVISILYLCYSVFPLSENSLPPILIATLGPSDLCLNGFFGGRISMADYSLEIFTPSSHPIPIKDVYLPIPPPWLLAFAMQIADGILHRLFLLKNHQAGPLAPGGK